MNIIINKKTYITPEIQCIELDNEISLALQSDIKPTGEPEGGPWAQDQHGIAPDPFKNQLG